MDNTTGFKQSKKKTDLSEGNIKDQLDFQRDTHRLKNEFWEKIVLSLLSSNFLVFLVTALIVGSGFYFMSKSDKLSDIVEYWKLIVPVVTTYMGYAIGRGQSKGE